MIVNLENVSYVAIAGLQVELHFKDTSSYMNRFSSLGEMLREIKGWQQKTRILNNITAAAASAGHRSRNK
ncbi:MAG: hypothetical protein ACXW32_07375 [Limisphaerales bacterium]